MPRRRIVIRPLVVPKSSAVLDEPRPRSLRRRKRIAIVSPDSARPGRNEFRQNAGGRVDDVAHRGPRPRIGRKVDIDARTEADKPVALPTLQPLTYLDVAQDTTRDQPGN